MEINFGVGLIPDFIVWIELWFKTMACIKI